MTPMTPGIAIVCILIAALLLFWLFAPTKWVSSELNAQGNGIQWLWAKLKGLFGKK